MKHLWNPTQECLKYVYENGQALLGYDTELAEEYRKRLQELPVYTNEEDAVQAFLDGWNNGKFNLWIFAKVGVDEEYFYVQDDYFLVTDDWRMFQAAEFLGLVNIRPNTIKA